MPTPNTPEPGCYVDSHWGQYAVARAVQVARELGWESPTDVFDLAARHLACMGPSNAESLTDDEFERLIEHADDAESWLNAHRAREGFWWGWNDGDFGLYLEGDE